MKRKIRLVHQIEITSRCNLKCKYCVHPTMKRPKVDMDLATYKAALELVRISVNEFGQRELNICGIGESTLHADFVEYARLAREAVGPAVTILLSCNGIGITEEFVSAVKPYRVLFYISMHRPEKAGPAIEILKRHGMLCGVDANAAINATDWAGQVKWFVSSPETKCFWVPDGRVFVDSEGNIRACCYDGDGKSVIGHVTDDNVFDLETSDYELCKTCHMNTNLNLAR